MRRKFRSFGIGKLVPERMGVGFLRVTESFGEDVFIKFINTQLITI